LRRSTSIRFVVLLVAAAAALALAGPAAAERYVVLYPEHGWGVWGAKSDVERAGGSIAAFYPQIGVVIADSTDPAFVSSLAKNRSVEGVAPTGSVVATPSGGGWWGDEPGLPNEPVADADTFSPLQWWAKRIKSPEAHAVTGGSPKVLVGVIDTGVDASHPDLDDNVDSSKSVSCVGGVPNRDPASWNDDSGHGTNVAGVIAAEANGRGIVGIAPKVKLAVIKASTRVGTSDLFLADAVICSFVWAAEHGVDVANNSYSVDSALSGGTTSFCRTDPSQRTMIKAVTRAVEYAGKRNVSVLASAGNNGLDLADHALEGCSRLPSGLPGVLTVTSTGLDDGLAAGPPSNYGLGKVDLAAPGGDFLQGTPPAGLVLGPWPASMQVPRLLCDPCEGSDAAFYRFFAGTSQATAQASGVAALVVSELGQKRWWWGGGAGLDPDRVSLILRQTADPLPCPVGDARCVTSGSRTSFFGKGVVNALRAVTHDKRDP
jgi:lantibiotic leader peptide-processing serine protease